MPTGFVYVLLNPSYPDVIKIGLTERTSEERARELRTTGVPTNFIVLYDELVTDCVAVESAVHRRLAGYRVSDDREFFRLPVKEAIRTLQEEASACRVNPLNLIRRVEILEALRQLYRGYLKPDIVSVAIVQPPGVCFLEVVRRAEGPETEIVDREDLQIFAGKDYDESLFSPGAPVEENAQRFVNELDAYDYIMTGMPLFTEEAWREIADLRKSGGKISRVEWVDPS
ncbi:MAG: GIY-YIG nuclease family protein [Ardenticatenales bacterium]|nr:GIY-YIG nuclease family protein [Ardenticatenales bacterium]